MEKKFLALIAIFSVMPCHAFNIQSIYNGRPVFAVGAGAAVTSDFGTSQNFPAANPDVDEFFNYTATSAYRTRALIEFFAGEEWTLTSPWFLQLGLDVSQIQVLPTNGVFLQGMDIPSANQYAYQYSLLTRQFLAEGKLLYQYHERYFPYFLLGLGIANNKAYNYSADVSPFTTFTRKYNNKTQNSFSYNLGVGVDATLTQNIRLGVGYRLTDLGNVYLGRANINGIGVGGTLHQTHLYVNEVITQLTWTT